MTTEYLYKYRNFEDENMEKIIKNSALYFSPIKYFNDPFDSKLDFRQNYSRKERLSYVKRLSKEYKYTPEQLIKAKDMVKKNENFVRVQKTTVADVVSEVGILSLSANPKNILMWSHYGHNHTGLVFEFKYHTSSTDYLRKAMSVEYKSSYDILSYTEIGDRRFEELGNLLLIKYTDWIYEEEYRAIELDYLGEKTFDTKDLVSIIFGINTSPKNIEDMINLCGLYDYSHVKFKKVRSIQGKFELDVIDL